MPIYYRERPHCRKSIEHLCRKYNCDIKELWNRNGVDFTLSSDLRKQLKKMLQEEGLKVR